MLFVVINVCPGGTGPQFWGHAAVMELSGFVEAWRTLTLPVSRMLSLQAGVGINTSPWEPDLQIALFSVLGYFKLGKAATVEIQLNDHFGIDSSVSIPATAVTPCMICAELVPVNLFFLFSLFPVDNPR